MGVDFIQILSKNGEKTPFLQLGTACARKSLMKISLALFCASFATGALAAGFGLNEMSARGNALQGTLVGSTRDASAAYFNPANLTELGDGIHSMLGLTFARPDYNTYVGGVRTDQDEHIFELPHLYVASRVADGLFLGLGEYTEFGLGTRYLNGKTWPLAADSTKTTMYSFTFSPTIGWQVADTLSLGAGLRLLYLNLISDRMLPAYASHCHMDTEDWALSYLASAAWQITRDLRFGVVYRAQADFHEEGDIALSPLGLGTGVKGDISMPQSVMAGFNWQCTERLNLGLNVTYVDWSVVKSLDQDFESPAFPDQKAPHNWHDTWRASVGAEYRINASWAVQGGVTHDLDPTDAGFANTMCPPGDRDQIGVGFTYAHGDWTFSADYMFVFIHSTDRDIHGVETHFRDLHTDTLGLTVGRRF